MDNIKSILAAGGLVCDRVCQQGGLTSREIAYSNLKLTRMRASVEVAPFGTLGDYVPFYFGTRSPMMLTYQSGNVTGRRENLDNLIYLATTAEAIVDAGHRFAFTDGHPIREPKAFYNDLTQLCQVDLPLMTERDWYDYNGDPDRMRRRQAEFLIWQRFPWEHVQVLGVRTASMATWLNETICDMSHQPPCLVRPAWYYSG